MDHVARGGSVGAAWKDGRASCAHAHIHTTTRGCQFLNIKGKSIYFNSLFEKVETILVHPTQSEIIQGFHYSFQLLGLWQKDKKKKASI